MSYFDPKSGNVKYDNKIVYDFYRTTVNKNEIESSVTNTSVNYFKAPFVNNSSNPNFYYTNDGTTKSYFTKNIYICKLLHNNIIGITDSNTNIIGELVIELQSTTSSEKCYVCFVLEKPPMYGAPPTGDIDSLLGLPKKDDSLSADIVLNNSISTQETAIVYNNNNASIFVFTESIIISSDSSTMVSGYGSDGMSGLFSANAPTDYVLIPHKNINIKQDDQIYINCNPTGESSETLNTYNLPINSELMNQKQDMDYMKTSVNFAIFSFVLVGCYFVVPPFYKFMVLDKIFRTKDAARLERVRSADILIGLFFAITAIIMFSVGASTENNMMYYGALFIILFYGLSSSIIGFHKLSIPEYLKTTKVVPAGGPPGGPPGGLPGGTPPGGSLFGSLGSMLTSSTRTTSTRSSGGNAIFGGAGVQSIIEETYKELNGEEKPDKFTKTRDIWEFLRLVAVYVVYTAGPMILASSGFVFFVLLILYLTSQIDRKWFTIMSTFGCLFILPVIVSLVSAVNIANE